MTELTADRGSMFKQEMVRIEAFIQRLKDAQSKLHFAGAGKETHILAIEGVYLRFQRALAGNYINPVPAPVMDATRFTPAAAVQLGMRVKNGNNRIAQPVHYVDALAQELKSQEDLLVMFQDAYARSQEVIEPAPAPEVTAEPLYEEDTSQGEGA